MKLICLGDDYIDYLYDNVERLYYPFKNYGFNMSFSKIDENNEIYVIRNVFTYKSLFDNDLYNKKRYIPGIEPLKKYLNDDFYINSNFSNRFIWEWKYNYETYIFFVGNLQKNGHIKINKNIKPEIILNPYYIFNLPKNFKNKLPTGHRIRKREDFRIYNLNKKIFITDSTTSDLTEIIVKNNKINLKPFLKNYKDICEYDEDNINKFQKTVENFYYKIFEKNWSLYKLDFINKKPNFYFFHDFSEIGIESVIYNTVYCRKIMIIKYKKDILPYNNNDYCRFSFGSTIHFENDCYYGVGHSKFFVKKKKYEIDEKYYKLKNIIDFIHKKIREAFKSRYKVHKDKVYGYYFFRYNEKKKEFFISNTFIPLILCHNYIFSLCFPTSIVKKHNKFFISMGYGDFTNIMAIYTKNEIDKKLIHNIEEFDFSKYKVEITYNEHKNN